MKYGAIYGRASLGRDRQGETIEHQIEMIKEFAKRSSIDVTFDDRFIYEDEDSGFKTTLLQRPAMKQLLHDIDAGLIEVVFFKGISRFARDSGETITTAKRLYNRGVRVVSLEENFDSSRDDPTMFQIYAVMAEQESRKTGIRVSLGNKSKARRGLWSNASTPYGYTRIKDLTDESLKEKLISEGRHPQSLHPDGNAFIVKKVFDMYVNLKYGKKRIASELNKQGYKTVRGLNIHAKYITDMLQNEAYIGNVVYGKSRYEYIENDDLTKKIQKTIKVDREEWAIAENAHPPIIDEELFQKAQKMHRRKRLSYNFDKNFNSAKHPLTGVLKCSKCGKRMTCQKRTTPRKDGTVKVYRYYICSTYHTQGRSACSQANIPSDILEEEVLRYIKKKIYEILKNYDFENEVVQKQESKNLMKQELIAINQNLANKMDSIKALMETRGIYDSETFAELNKDINEEIKVLRKRKEAIEMDIKSTDKDEEVFNVKNLLDEFTESDIIPQKDLRELFMNVLVNVTVEDRKVKTIKTIPLLV